MSTLNDLIKFPPDPAPIFLYRIRRKSDGKYSTGTSSPKWTKNGKFFPHYQAVQAHLLWFLAGPAYYDFEGDIRIDRYHKPNPEDYVLERYTCSLSYVKQLIEVMP